MSAPVGTSYSVTLLRRGRVLEVITLAWNVVGIVVLAVAALRAHSVALAGFGSLARSVPHRRALGTVRGR